jgi:hypothetical protein
VHTFKAKTTYCLQTIQLACGFPIGWGKCYRSESTPQVLAILNQIWEHHPNSRPSFIAYNDACDLLRHIVTQNPNDPWLSTKFIVDTSVTEQPIFFVGYGAILRRRTVLNPIWFWLKRMASVAKLERLIPNS